MQLHNKTVGKEGEEKAVNYLKEKNYEIITQNWRTKTGEIDIIAYKDHTLVFVEVKSLPNGDLDYLNHVIGKIKQKKIVETAKCFLNFNRKYNDSFIRFDVVVIDLPGLKPVYHIENAFTEFL